MRLPAFLLTHTVTVSPYASWSVYGAPFALRCAIGERLANASTQTGIERVAQLTLVAMPDAVVPAGSRITLADGREGYASAVARHSGGGLPTPDHVEIAVTVADAYGPAHGETIILLRRTLLSGRDRYGNDRYATTQVPIAGAAVRALTSQEDTKEARDRVVDSIEVILPPGTVVTPVDRLQVRGLTYEIDGTPDPQVSPSTGVAPGIRVIARRVTGA